MNTNTKFLVQDSAGKYQFATDEMILFQARAIVKSMNAKGTQFDSPTKIKSFLADMLGGETVEVFGLLLLDNQHQLIEYVEVSRGTIDQTSVYPREVAKLCLMKNAAAVVLTHNHPSGVSTPSNADIGITQKLKHALSLIDVRTLDHIIVAGNNQVSFAERGLM